MSEHLQSIMDRAKKGSGATEILDKDKDNHYYDVDFIFASTATVERLWSKAKHLLSLPILSNI